MLCRGMGAFVYDIYLLMSLLCYSYCVGSLCRYHEILFVIDTCQAQSMYQKFYSPNLIGIASSLVGEDSLSVGQPISNCQKMVSSIVNELLLRCFSIKVTQRLERMLSIVSLTMRCFSSKKSTVIATQHWGSS